MRKKLFTLLTLLTISISIFPQNWNLVWREDFGVVEDSVIKNFPDPSMSVPGHQFDECIQINDGYYGIANSPWWAFNRKEECHMASAAHFTPGGDHTGNLNGGMLIVNVGSEGKGEVIYEQTMKFDACDNSKYRFTIFGCCVSFSNSRLMLSNLTLNIVNVKDPDHPKVVATMETGDLPLWEFNNANNYNPNGIYTHSRENKAWKQCDLEFTANEGDILKLQVLNHCKSGLGNDFALDDISLYRQDTEEVVEPIIQIGRSYHGDPINGECHTKTEYVVENDFLSSWNKIYDYTYCIWQESIDDGYSWHNLPQGAGINMTMVTVENPDNNPKVYRLITTGGSTAEEAKKEAEYIAEHGGPSNGCVYFSISNTLTTLPDETSSCDLNDHLMKIWSNNFGTIDSTQTRGFEYVGADFQKFDTLQAEPFNSGGYYAITCAPDKSIFTMPDGVTKAYSENYQMAGFTGGANDAFLLFSMPASAQNMLLLEMDLPARVICHCRQHMFNLRVKAPTRSGANHVMNIIIEDGNGDVIASKKFNGSFSGDYKTYSLPFSVNSDGLFSAHVKVYCTNHSSQNISVAIDNLSITSCEEFIPTAETGIDGEKNKKYYGVYDCGDPNENHTVSLFHEEWLAQYNHPEFIWQKSYDGIAWETLLGSENKVTIAHTPVGEGMVMYRTIIAPEKPTVDEIARDGFPHDPCRKYYITDPVTFSCKETLCDIPTFTIDSIPAYACHGASVTLKANVELNTTNTFAWKRNGETINTTDLVLTDIPTDTTTYEFVIYGAHCPEQKLQDTSIALQSDPIHLSIEKDSLCGGEKIALSAHRNITDIPLVWEYSTDSTKTFVAYTPNETEEAEMPLQSTHYRLRTDSTNCPSIYSDTVFAYVEKRVEVLLNQLPDTICDGVEVTIKASAELDEKINSYVWVVNSDTLKDHQEFEYKEVPLIATTYQFVVFGKVCEPSVDSTHTVVYTEHGVEISIDKDTVCEGSPVRVTAEYDYNATVVWQYSHDQNQWTNFAPDEIPSDLIRRPNEVPKTKPTANVTPETTTYYRVKVPQTHICPTTFSFTVTAYVEKKAKDVEIVDFKKKICEGNPLTLKGSALIDPEIHTIAWMKNSDTISKGDFECSDTPKQDAGYRFVVMGHYCPPLSAEENVSVISSGRDISLELQDPRQSKVCEGEYIKLINITEVTNNQIVPVREKSTDGVNYTEIDETTEAKAYNPTVKTYYRIKTTSGSEECPDQYSNVVEVDVEKKVSVSVDNLPTIICAGTDVHLNAVATLSDFNRFAWIKEGDTLSKSELSLTDTPSDTTLYQFVVEGDRCEKVEKSYKVKVEQQPEVRLTLTPQGACEGDDVTLNAEFSHVKALLWQKKSADDETFSTFSNSLTGEMTIKAEKTAAYRIISTQEEKCASATSEEITLEVEPKLTVTLPEQYLICSYQQKEISAEFSHEPLSFTWYKKGIDNTDFEATDIQTTTFTTYPQSTTEYRLDYRSKYCPSDNVNTIVYVDNGVELTPIENDTLCGGESVILQTTCENPSSLVWEALTQSGNDTVAVGVETLEYAPSATTEYRVTGKSEHGCISQPVLTTVVVYKPVEATMTEGEICLGDSLALLLGGFTDYTQIAWFSSEDEFQRPIGESTQQEVKPTQTTTYRALVRNGVCESTAESQVEVYAQPVVLSCDDQGSYYELNVESELQPVYFNYGDGSQTTTSNILENVTFGSTYHITITNDLGCATTYVLETPLYEINIPEYFVAGRDNWVVENLNRYPKSTYTIYDRFGKVIYEGVGDDLGWDGTYNNRNMPSTDYWYVINLPEIDRQFHGHFTLLRE